MVTNDVKDETFNEEALEKLSEELKLSAEENERISKIRDILNGGGVTTTEEVDPDTVMAEDYDSDLFAMVEEESKKIDLIDIAISGIESNKIPLEEIVSKSSSVLPGVPAEDVLTMVKVAQKYRKDEDFSVYNALPESVKAIIKKEAGILDKTALNMFSKLVLEEFCTEVLDVTFEKEAIDFNESLKEALNIPDITDLYKGYIRQSMETELLDKAAALEKEGFVDGAKVLRDCSQSFTDSYTFVRLREAIKGKTRRKLYKDNESYDRYCNDFNYKIQKSKFKITDVFELGRVLDKLSPVIGISKDDVLMLVILFCKTCQNYDANNTSDGIFMYYTIRNILNMEHHSVVGAAAVELDEFDQVIIDNIALLVNDIHTIVNERSNKQ